MLLKPIKIESTEKALSALGGLCLFDHIYNSLDLGKRPAPLLPRRLTSRSFSSIGHAATAKTLSES